MQPNTAYHATKGQYYPNNAPGSVTRLPSIPTAGYGGNPYQQPMQSPMQAPVQSPMNQLHAGRGYQQVGSIPVLPPVPQAYPRGHTAAPRPMQGQMMVANPAPMRGVSMPRTPGTGVKYPHMVYRHVGMHTPHSEVLQSIPHKQYPEHITTVRIRTPSQWGPSRLGTPIELRSTMSTIERYRLNPSKTNPSFNYEPYSASEFRSMKSRYQHMKLPRSLGPAEDERWKIEHDKRARMSQYANTVKNMEIEMKDRRNARKRVSINDEPSQRPPVAVQDPRWRA
ncbi:hypothetical protein HDV03_003803 [Kappamyces sp. JEL0829]|nr:hypothetical protein HDV03_003803 [Kappamyces sp. JEL0829]